MVVQFPRDASPGRAGLYILKGKTNGHLRWRFCSTALEAEARFYNGPSSDASWTFLLYVKSGGRASSLLPKSPAWTSKGKRKPRAWAQADGPKDQPPFLCFGLQPCWTTAHHTLSQAPASALLRLSGPLPAAWGVPAHPLTPTSSETCSLHLLTPTIHPESSSCRLFEQVPLEHVPSELPLLLTPVCSTWTESPLMARPCTEGGLTKYLLSWKESSPSLCIEAGLSKRHPHGWGSGLLVRPPKKVTSPMFSETSPNTQWPCHLTIFTFQLSTKHVLPCPTSVPWDLSWNPSYTSASITSFVP